MFSNSKATVNENGHDLIEKWDIDNYYEYIVSFFFNIEHLLIMVYNSVGNLPGAYCKLIWKFLLIFFYNFNIKNAGCTL